MIEVVPAIIPESFDDLESQMARVKGHVSRVQIDVANGSYAPSTTWPFKNNEHFEKLVHEEEGLPFWREIDVELDMLVRGPERFIDDWVHVGIAAAIIHIESTTQHSQILENLRMHKVEVGWGMVPNTPNEQLFEIIETVGMPNFVQVMGNDRIGYHGVGLDERVYDKVHALRSMFHDLPIAVDIGVNGETAPKLVEAGATKLVSGSAIFDSENVGEAIEYFQSLG